MVETADVFLQPGEELTFFVFTDQPAAAAAHARVLSRSRIVVVEIPPLGWPEATLLRYQLFADSWHRVSQHVVMHVDADMEFCSVTNVLEDCERWLGGIALVRHPGFRRQGIARRVIMYVRDPRFLKSDLVGWIRVGALGGWELSVKSLAYVPRRKRSTYVCGGIWMGLNEHLRHLVEELAARTRADLDNAVVATWHDESHLNWYASNRTCELLDSDLCFIEGNLNLSDLTPKVLAVEKGANRTR